MNGRRNKCTLVEASLLPRLLEVRNVDERASIIFEDASKNGVRITLSFKGMAFSEQGSPHVFGLGNYLWHFALDHIKVSKF